MDIQQEIQRQLGEIERKEGVTILFAIESGSRAWGFASPDSDYDVRFVYKHKLPFYLSLEKRRDVIEYPPDEVFDVNGWDLDKTLRLLHGSNPTLFEWTASPVVYRTTPFHTAFKKLLPAYFLSKSGLNHYLSMAVGNYREYLRTDTVKLKKYFYVIRPLLACRWILKNGTPPPVRFDELAAACLEEDLHEELHKLLSWKMAAPESETGKRIDRLNMWIEENLTALKQDISALKPGPKQGWEELNRLFLSEIS